MKKLCIILLAVVLLTGCNTENFEITNAHNEIVEFIEKSHYGTTKGLCDLHYKLYNDNTIEIYGYYNTGNIVLEYIPGLIFSITEEEKQSLINSIYEYQLADLNEDLGSGNGGIEESIVLYDKDSSIYKKISGVSPENIYFIKFKAEFFRIMPEKEFKQGIEIVVKKINDRLELKVLA